MVEPGDPVAGARWCLVLQWSAEEPERVGEVAFIEAGRTYLLGRDGTWEAGGMPTLFAPRRHEALRPGRPLSGRAISRRQLEITITEAGLHVRNLGRCALLVEGRPIDEAVVPAGRCVALAGQVVMLCARRAAIDAPTHEHAFGDPDAFGIVGESPATWQLRSALRAASPEASVLLLGEAGTGKERAARALHACSPRRLQPMITHNAATLPRDEEAMIETLGALVEEAAESTLFLDEVDAFPAAVQLHLAAVLAGEAQTRFVLACDRGVEALEAELVAEIAERIHVPSLADRRGDIGLLAPHLLREAAMTTPEVAERYFVGGEPTGRPRLAPSLVAALVEHDYARHVRELSGHLWRAITDSRGNSLELVSGLVGVLAPAPRDA